MSQSIPPLVPTRNLNLEAATNYSLDVYSGIGDSGNSSANFHRNGITSPPLDSPELAHTRKNSHQQAAAPPRATILAGLVDSWLEEFNKVLRSAESWDACLRGVASVIHQDPTCNAIWLASIQNSDTDLSNQETENQSIKSTKPSNSIQFKIKALSEFAATVWQVVGDMAQRMLNEVSSDRQSRQVQFHQSLRQHLIAIPIEFPKETLSALTAQSRLILIVCFDQSQQIEHRNWLMGLACRTITDWLQLQNWHRAQIEHDKGTQILALNAELDRSTSTVDAARILVNRIRLTFKLQQVAITIGGKLLAVSDLEIIDRQSQASRTLEQACHQSCLTGKSILFSEEEGIKSADQLPLQAFCQMRGLKSCLSLPLCSHQNGSSANTAGLIAEAAVLLVGDHQQISNPSFVERASKIGTRIGDHLNVVLTSHQNLRQRIGLGITCLMRHRWRKGVAVAVVALTMLLAMPMPYRIGCDCEMQPVLRRFVNAPFDSVLEKTLVKNGDMVAQDQILARLDGRLIRIELAGLEAELAGAKKRHDQELAIGNVAASQIAKSEMERLRAKIALLQDRSSQLEIRAPLDGIVINGDLEKVEGAPLTVGQTLFEVAPLREMIAEVAIPESEVLYAKTGMPVALKLNTYPFRTWQGKIESIHTSSEIINNESVFIANVRLENDEDLIRPGMKGQAKIQSQWKPFGWNLFHRSWEQVRYWLIW